LWLLFPLNLWNIYNNNFKVMPTIPTCRSLRVYFYWLLLLTVYHCSLFFLKLITFHDILDITDETLCRLQISYFQTGTSSADHPEALFYILFTLHFVILNPSTVLPPKPTLVTFPSMEILGSLLSRSKSSSEGQSWNICSSF
jgi:hypothetical protein